MRQFIAIAVVAAAAVLAFAMPTRASEDWYTTDFQTDFQPPAGIGAFYDFSNILTPSDISGNILVQKYGIEAEPIPGVELFLAGQHLGFDAKRTNHYQFDFAGSDYGLKLTVLPERHNVLGLDVGVCQEQNFPNHVFKNGADLNLISPSDSAFYGFLLMSKQISPKWRVNAGVKWGNAYAGPVNGSSYNWSAGAEYQLAKNLSLQGNFKQTFLEGLNSNENLSLRLKYEPVTNLQLQLEGDYYTNGLLGQVPALELISDLTTANRFENRGVAAIGLSLKYRFNFSGNAGTTSPPPPNTKPSKDEQKSNEAKPPSEKQNQPPAPQATPKAPQPSKDASPKPSAEPTP